MFETLMIFLMLIGIIAVIGLFALSICWAAHEAEIMKGEEDDDDHRRNDKGFVRKNG